MPIELICLDADDTLWHNMRHFEEAQDAFVAMLEPFAAADVAIETLEACEARNLKLYGYGAKGFTLSMSGCRAGSLPTCSAQGGGCSRIRSNCFTGSRRRSMPWPSAVDWCW